MPGKNLRSIHGESLVRNALRKAVLSSAFDHIVLSSDDPSILAEARGLNVIALPRSAGNATDTATSEAVLTEVLEHFGLTDGMLAMIQCTTPFLSISDITKAAALQQKNRPCTVVSGYAESSHHWVLSGNDALKPVGDSGKLRQPRQSAKDRIFVENGGIYITDIGDFLTSGNRFNGRVLPLVMEKSASIDIDDEQDIVLAMGKNI